MQHFAGWSIRFSLWNPPIFAGELPMFPRPQPDPRIHGRVAENQHRARYLNWSAGEDFQLDHPLVKNCGTIHTHPFYIYNIYIRIIIYICIYIYIQYIYLDEHSQMKSYFFWMWREGYCSASTFQRSDRKLDRESNLNSFTQQILIKKVAWIVR